MIARLRWRIKGRIKDRDEVRRWFWRTPPGLRGLVVGAAVIVFAVFAWLLWRGPTRFDGAALRGLTPIQRQTAIDADRGRLIQLGAGLLAAGALVYTGLNFRLSREGHVTDRFTKAIEQLGSERLDVRLGAIYALERIMIDSARDHPTIVEVLAAYVREHAPLPSVKAGEERPMVRPATDVQAAMTVLGRRPSGRGSVNLRFVYLPLINLRKANFDYADLTGADLRGAYVNNATLRFAGLMNADLRNAFLSAIDMRFAILVAADLRGADLSYTLLDRSNLSGANLQGANLLNAKYDNLWTDEDFPDLADGADER